MKEVDEARQRVEAFLADLKTLTEKHRIYLTHECGSDQFGAVPLDETTPDGYAVWFAACEWDQETRTYRCRVS